MNYQIHSNSGFGMQIQFFSLQNICSLLFHLLHYCRCSGYFYWLWLPCIQTYVSGKQHDSLPFRVYPGRSILAFYNPWKWIRAHDLDLAHRVYTPGWSFRSSVSVTKQPGQLRIYFCGYDSGIQCPKVLAAPGVALAVSISASG